jgi:hypothetical protein
MAACPTAVGPRKTEKVVPSSKGIFVGVNERTFTEVNPHTEKPTPTIQKN